VPKARGIKPETWTDEVFATLTPYARLLYIGMWNWACDAGHLEDKPTQIKMRILPLDPISGPDLVDELEAAGRITRADGYITVRRFSHHQRIDVRYFVSCEKPGCEDPPGKIQRKTRSAHTVPTTGAHSAHTVRTPCARIEGEGEGEGEGEKKTGATKPKRATSLPEVWMPNDKHREIAKDNGVDILVECVQFIDHALANGKTFKDWDAAFRTWLRNAAKFNRGTQPAPKRTVAVVRQEVAPIGGMSNDEYRALFRRERGLDG
jgi:hypothetical protein